MNNQGKNQLSDLELLARDAIEYTLARIRDDDKLQYLLGAGTETFGRLAKAAAALRGIASDEALEKYIPGSSGLYDPPTMTMCLDCGENAPETGCLCDECRQQMLGDA